MKVAKNNRDYFLNNIGLIKLKDKIWADKQRIAGKVAAQALSLLASLVQNRTTLSLLELDKMAENLIISQDCQPTFKGYQGFPNCCCISVNKQLVHGIPTNYHLQEGDVVSFDLGATYQGVIADTAITCIYGEPKDQTHVKLLTATYEALMKGIAAIKPGCQLGAIGEAIYKSAKGNGFNVIEQFGGHGICQTDDEIGIPHAQPFVANKDRADRGMRLVPGMTLAIEPLLIAGSTTTQVGEDDWTVVTPGGIGNHFEHTIFIHTDRVEIMTLREEENETQL